jgi:hypothetical protein
MTGGGLWPADHASRQLDGGHADDGGSLVAGRLGGALVHQGPHMLPGMATAHLKIG